MDIVKRAMGTKWVGVGGWGCSCCRPKRSDHRKAYRYARRVVKAQDRKLFNTGE